MRTRGYALGLAALARIRCNSKVLDGEGGRLITSHGFRTTFRDWAGKQSAFPREVIEHALAHQLPDKAEAAYQRGSLFPKRVKLMQAWADFHIGRYQPAQKWLKFT